MFIYYVMSRGKAIKSTSIVLWLCLVLSGSACLAADSQFPTDAFYCQAFPNDTFASLCYLQPDNALSQWYLVQRVSILKIDIDDTEAQMHGFTFSPSERFLAVESSGEGHSLLQVYDSHLLLARNQVDYLQGWGGYPGWVNFAGWDGDALIIESNVPLDQDYDTTVDYPEDESAFFRWCAEQPALEKLG